MQHLDKDFMGLLKIYYCQEIEKSSVHTQDDSSPSAKLANYLEIHTSEVQQAK